eukprot:XP_001705000.1 Hypothetical protein GL50803_31532 [Giardia lamblia ATCC 50803]
MNVGTRVGEPNALLGKHSHLLAADIFVGNLLHIDNLNIMVARTALSSHLRVNLVHRSSARGLTHLAIHVMLAYTGTIAQENTEVLNKIPILLNVLAVKDLSVRALDLLQRLQVVPEAALCYDLVGGVDCHAEDLRFWEFLRRKPAAVDDILLHHPSGLGPAF